MAVKKKETIQDVSKRQLAIERRLSELADAIEALQARVADLSKSAAMQKAAEPAAGAKAAATAVTEAVHRETGDVSPEILVMIAAAVTAFLGKKVRIRSAKMLQSPYEVVNPWSQQGRVYVQALHFLRSRG